MSHKGESENGSHYNKGGGATKNVFSKKKGKKRTSYVNDNGWWSKLAKGFKNLGSSYEPQKLVRRMEFREGLSKNKENKGFSRDELSSYKERESFLFKTKGMNQRQLAEVWEQGRTHDPHFADAMQDPWNARKKQNSDNASKY